MDQDLIWYYRTMARIMAIKRTRYTEKSEILIVCRVALVAL